MRSDLANIQVEIRQPLLRKTIGFRDERAPNVSVLLTKQHQRMIDLEQIKGFNDENTNNDLARKLKGNTEKKPICRCLLETVKCLLLMSSLGQKSIQTYCCMTRQSSGQIRLLSLRLVQTYEHVHEELRLPLW